jgi:hypothetical protein
MRRITTALYTVAALLTLHGPAQADFFPNPYPRESISEITVLNSANNVPVAVTVTYVGRSLNPAVVETVSALENRTIALPKVDRSVKRVVIEVDPASAGTVLVKFSIESEVVVQGYGRLVIDVHAGG